MSPEGLGEPETYTSNFKLGPVADIYGPYKDVQAYSMETALGFTPKHSELIADSKLCASCHMVVVPTLDIDKTYTPASFAAAHTHHEQTTFNEWRNSSYWSPDYEGDTQTCQSCHMPRVVDDIAPFTPENPLELEFRIANIEDLTYPWFMNQAADDKIALTVTTSKAPSRA